MIKHYHRFIVLLCRLFHFLVTLRFVCFPFLYLREPLFLDFLDFIDFIDFLPPLINSNPDQLHHSLTGGILMICSKINVCI